MELMARNPPNGHLHHAHGRDQRGVLAGSSEQKILRHASIENLPTRSADCSSMIGTWLELLRSGGAALTCPSGDEVAEQYSHGSLSCSSELRCSRSTRKQGTSASRASHFAVHFKATKGHNGHCTINVSHILWSALSVSGLGITSCKMRSSSDSLQLFV